ncbi:MAG: hypothetical protein JWO58_456 [Chitinophagaceae bacterium]|nr:hypothetical protein [Chitinophagaceae bacterium]
MKAIFNLFVISSLVLSCSMSKNHKKNLLEGEWKLIDNQLNYPSIRFDKLNTALLTSRADTIYRFTYNVRSDKLILKDLNGKVYENRILKLDSDSLIFENLFKNNFIQKYIRK